MLIRATLSLALTLPQVDAAKAVRAMPMFKAKKFFRTEGEEKEEKEYPILNIQYPIRKKQEMKNAH